ncbi:hypothetical protein VTO73DRAFT_14450 [Trametes versicolor]
MIARCPICTEYFSNDNNELQAMRLAHCGHVLCFGCLSRILQDGSASCPNRCNRSAQITTWLPLHLSVKPVLVPTEDEATIAIDKKFSELVNRQVAAEKRHLTVSKELNVITSQVQNQYDLINGRNRYIHTALSNLQDTRDASADRNEKLLKTISRVHRLRRLASREAPLASMSNNGRGHQAVVIVVNEVRDARSLSSQKLTPLQYANASASASNASASTSNASASISNASASTSNASASASSGASASFGASSFDASSSGESSSGESTYVAIPRRAGARFRSTRPREHTRSYGSSPKRRRF